MWGFSLIIAFVLWLFPFRRLLARHAKREALVFSLLMAVGMALLAARSEGFHGLDMMRYLSPLTMTQ